MPDEPAYSAKNPALEAAQALADEGEHVHYVAEGEARCISGRCRTHGP